MKDFLDTIWNFPAKHVALGWWLAAAITFWNVIAKFLVNILGRLSLLGRRFRIDQLEKRISWIESLHDNSNGLLRYIMKDAISSLTQICGYAILLTVGLSSLAAKNPASILLLVIANASFISIGPLWRIGTMLTDIERYPGSVKKL